MDDEFIYSFRSRNGLLLKIRPLVPDDAGHLVDLFKHMGPESRFLRFNLALSNPDPELIRVEAQRMSEVDPEKDGAWLVFGDLPDQENAPVAGGRYVRLDDDTAEASLAVRDDMQRQGIGSHLLQFMVRQARDRGVKRLIATVQRGNRPLWHMLQGSGLKYDVESLGGYSNIAVDLLQLEAN